MKFPESYVGQQTPEKWRKGTTAEMYSNNKDKNFLVL